MPGFDRTGPQGQGPGTGGRRGPCLNADAPVPGYEAEADKAPEQPIIQDNTLPAVNDVVVDVDTASIPGKAIIKFESGKKVEVDNIKQEPITVQAGVITIR